MGVLCAWHVSVVFYSKVHYIYVHLIRNTHLLLHHNNNRPNFRFVISDKLYIVRQLSPLFCSNLDLEYIVFSLQNIVVQTPHLKNPEGVEVSPLGNFSYSRFFKMAANSLSGNVIFSLSALEICIIPLFQLN